MEGVTRIEQKIGGVALGTIEDCQSVKAPCLKLIY